MQTPFWRARRWNVFQLYRGEVLSHYCVFLYLYQSSQFSLHRLLRRHIHVHDLWGLKQRCKWIIPLKDARHFHCSSSSNSDNGSMPSDWSAQISFCACSSGVIAYTVISTMNVRIFPYAFHGWFILMLCCLHRYISAVSFSAKFLAPILVVEPVRRFVMFGVEPPSMRYETHY